MKLAAVLNNRMMELENRKRVVNQRSVGEAYRKTAQYFEPQANPALEELVDLLTGKKEKQQQTEVQATIRDIKIEDTNLLKTNLVQEMEQKELDLPEGDDLVSIFKRIRASALNVDQPTEIDYRIAQSAGAFIEADEDSLQKDSSSRSAQIISEEKVEQHRFNKLFSQAIKRYQFHTNMTQNGFALESSSIYITA